MMNNVFKKSLAIGIIILFIGASVLPSISGNFEKQTNSNFKVDNDNSDSTLKNDNFQDDNPKETDWWPRIKHDLSNTGCSLGVGPETKNVIWSYNYSDDVHFYTTPIVYNDKIYIGAYTNSPQIYCLDADDGGIIWTSPVGGSVGCPAVYNDKLYFGASDKKVYCYDAYTGDEIWEYLTDGSTYYSSPAVYNGKVYIGNLQGQVYCLDANTGEKIWHIAVAGEVDTCPAIYNSFLYIGCKYRLYCLNLETGDEIWNMSSNWYFQTPIIAYDKLYVVGGSGPDQELYCLNLVNGDIIWQRHISFYMSGDSITVYGGMLYIISDIYPDRIIFCLNAEDSTTIWNYLMPQYFSIIGNLLVAADGKIYFAIAVNGEGDSICCHDAYSGSTIWEKYFDDPGDEEPRTSPSIADGKMFLVTENGEYDCRYIYCIGDEIWPVANAGGPYNGKTGQNILLDASGSTDPNGDILSYRWDFTNDGVWDTPWNSNPVFIYQYNSSFQGEVKVEVSNSNGFTDTDTANIDIINNIPPFIPSNPNPQHGATGVDEEIDLSWTCGDPNNDIVTYEVYIGKTNPPPLKAIGVTSCYYDPGRLDDLTTYYWRVNAIDIYGASSLGPIWQFTTVYENDPPDKPKQPSGSISCKIGISNYYYYTTYTIDPENDQIYYQIGATFSILPQTPSSGSQWFGPYSSGEACNLAYTFEQLTDYYQYYWLSIRAKDSQGYIGSWSPLLQISTYDTNAYPTAEIISIEPLDIHSSELFTLKGTYTDPEGDTATRCCWYIQTMNYPYSNSVIYEGPYQQVIQKYYTGLEPNKLYTIFFAVTDRTPTNNDWFLYAPNQARSDYHLVWDLQAYGDVPSYPYGENHNASIGICSAYSACNSDIGAVSAGFVNLIGGSDAWANMHSMSFNIPETLHRVGLKAEIAYLGGNFDFAVAASAMKFQFSLYKLVDGNWVDQETYSNIHWICNPLSEQIITNIIVDNFLKKYFFPGWFGDITEAVSMFCTISDMLKLGEKLRSNEYVDFVTTQLVMDELDPGTYKIVPFIAGAGAALLLGAGTAVTYGQITYMMIRELTTSEYNEWLGLNNPPQSSYILNNPEQSSDIYDFNIHIRGPADITVVDPQDNILNKTNSSILYAYYLESDIDGDGQKDDFLHIPYAINGTYKIYLTPEANASVNDTLNVTIITSSGNHTYLLDNVTIGNLTTTPYNYNVQSSNTPYIQIKPFDTFRISNYTLLINWDAFDPDDGYNLPISLFISNSSDENWTLIESNYSNTGQYLYDISNIDGGLYRFKILTNDSDGNFRYSISNYYMITNRTESIFNVIPVANFTYNIDNKTVYFNASSSFDYDGIITSYHWDFGDQNNGTGVEINHTYSDYIFYNVTLTVFDDNGKIGIAYKNISIVLSVYNPLLPGWNLITVPAESDWWASNLAGNVSGCELVSWFNGSSQSFESYITGGPLQFDFPILDGYGYFILVNQSSNLMVSGYCIDNVSIPLFVGWNIIGWYHEYNTLASSLAENISGSEMVSWFNASSQSFESFIVGGPPQFDFTIIPGMGVFVLVDEDSIWYGEG